MSEQRVLVTGGSGFIGSHLTKRLLHEGARVTVVVKYLSVIDNVRLSSVWGDIEVIEADLRNLDAVRQLAAHRFDTVFHLAAYNHVGDSFHQPTEALSSSLLATANLLEALADRYDRFVYTSSSEVYGLQQSLPLREEMLPLPISPYSVGKYAGELYARMKRQQTGHAIVCLRPFNTFGPYQSEKAIIPELIMACLRGEPVRTTEGEQTREFNFVDNIVDAFLLAAAVDPPPADVINIGCGEEITIRDLVHKIHPLCDSDSELLIGDLPYRPTEIWRMSAANARAREILGWRPRVGFEEGLRITVQWYRAFVDVFEGLGAALNRL